MILKLRQFIDGGFGRVTEDHIVENPKEVSISKNRKYNNKLAKLLQIDALFPLSDKECLCNFITYYLDDEFHSYACWPNTIFIMSDTGKTIDKY